MKTVVASWDPGDELLLRVASWSWVAAELRGRAGVQPVIQALCAGVALHLVSINRRAPRVIEVTVSSGTNHCTVPATTPLVAAVLSCWIALSRHRRAGVPELDELVVGALSRGELTAAELGTSWGRVEELWPGRTCPPEVLARATIELAMSAQDPEDVERMTAQERARARRGP